MALRAPEDFGVSPVPPVLLELLVPEVCQELTVRPARKGRVAPRATRVLAVQKAALVRWAHVACPVPGVSWAVKVLLARKVLLVLKAARA